MEEKSTNLKDSRIWAKLSVKTILLGVLGLAVYVKLLPFLITLVWGTTELIVGGSILAALLYVITSKGTWRRLGYFSDKVAKLLTIWLIEWDEFIIQENAIKEAKKKRQEIARHAETLFGQVAEKDAELEIAERRKRDAKGAVEELQLQGLTAEDVELRSYANEFSRQQEFIETISPLREQIENLAKLCQKVYKETGEKIKDAEQELDVQKSRLKSLTAGEKAMRNALNIFAGENPDVKLAEAVVKQKIGEKIGSIRNTLDIINPIMNQGALKNTVRVKEALRQLNAVNADNTIQIPMQQEAKKISLFN